MTRLREPRLTMKGERRACRSPLICLVCGDVARGHNFDVITCMSCKAFFRRHGWKTKLTSHCQFENDCPINLKTRSFCSPCRLKKCLRLGMCADLIRHVASSSPQSKSKLVTPRSLDLLEHDRSTLTSEQWTILSNFIHAFDAQDPSKRIQSLLQHLSTVPPKSRLKPSDTYQMIGQFFISIQSLIADSLDFCSLSIDARRTLTKHNFDSVGSLNGVFLCRELDLYSNETFSNACGLHYGSEYLKGCFRTSQRCDANGSLMKIMLFVFTYSSNCSIVTWNPREDLQSMASSLDLIRIQDIYVMIIWKYLLYLYGFQGAVLRLSSLVKNMLDVIRMLETMPINPRHLEMVREIVDETERSLVVAHPMEG